MKLISETPRSEREFSASSTYPMYLTTQRKQKKPQMPKNPKTPNQKSTVLNKRLSVTNVSLEKGTSSAEEAIINYFT